VRGERERKEREREGRGGGKREGGGEEGRRGGRLMCLVFCFEYKKRRGEERCVGLCRMYSIRAYKY
jgi:hypothetical protein